ncbi:hypothetical protein E3U43_009607 [Larimichthys crocea]|uniref:Uncharacterized protein n=1 Tax=Larimichthys crocea TaxID=215358 RepID=A0ACD3QB74_LARCR|nr:hypothetical protein E3U43_009607 [Larimichthys crocea]
MTLIKNKSVRSELEGYMITVSSIGDNQHSEEKVAARFLCEEEPTDAVFSFFFFSGSSLCCSSRKGTLSIWLVKLQYIVFALPVNPVQRTKAELSLAQGGQRRLLKWHNMTALV